MSDNPWEALLTRLVGEAGPGGHKLNLEVFWDTTQHAAVMTQVYASMAGFSTGGTLNHLGGTWMPLR